VARDGKGELSLPFASSFDTTMINAQESRMAVSEAIQDWLSCLRTKNASTG